MLQSSVQELVNWMFESTDDEEMTSAISTYLMIQGETTLGEAADATINNWRCNENDQYKHL